MPVEPSPIPFGKEQTLPYLPKFSRPEIEGVGPAGSAMGYSGPASAAASTMIAPTPGGVADPHHAIPALPDVGYTAPSVRLAPKSLDPRGQAAGAYGPPGPRTIQSGYGPSEYAYGYGGQSVHMLPPVAPSSAYSGGWAAASLPAPRARQFGPPPPPEMVVGPSEYGPCHCHLHAEDDHLNHHHNHHHRHQEPRHQPHHHHQHRRPDDDDSDRGSDISYYAKPKHGRGRSASVSSSISGLSSPREPHHHRQAPSASGRAIHQNNAGIDSPTHQAHRVISSSPLGPPPNHLAPPRSPSKDHGLRNGNGHEERVRTHSNLAPPPAFEGSPRHVSRSRSRRRPSVSGGEHLAAPRAAEDDQRSRRYSSPPSERRNALEVEVDLEELHVDEDGYRRRHHSHVPPPAPAPPTDSDRPPMRRHHSHHHQPPPVSPRQVAHGHHRHHRSEDGFDRNAGYAHTQLEPPGSQVPRRRAVSMHLVGYPPMMQGPYQLPGVNGYRAMDAYDDGASIAGSAMTFMDGSVAGRVSQYGLPKYPHQPKMDYRRLCVQRGNADVYLDGAVM